MLTGGIDLSSTRKGRRYSREILLQVLYEAAVAGRQAALLLESRAQELELGEEERSYARHLCSTIDGLLSEIDAEIAAAAPQWPLSQIAKIDLSVMRMAVAELMLAEVPVAVIINEAVELAKSYGAQSTGAFVNGALGSIARKIESRARPAEVDPR